MNERGAGTVLAALTLTAGVVTFRGLQSGSLTPRAYAAFGVVAFMLLGVTAFYPELGAALAILVLVSVLLGSREDIEAIGRLAGRGK